MPDYRVFIQSLVTDNKHIDAGYIEQLKNSVETTKQRLLYGNFDYADGDLNLYKFSHIMDSMDREPTNDGVLYCSADIARFGDDTIRIIVRD